MRRIKSGPLIVKVSALVLMCCAPVEAAIRFVRAAASGANNGTSWTDAFVDLQAALAVAQNGDEIRVASGIYKPAAPGGSRSSTFQLISGVQVLGGYSGTGADPDARDPATNVTTLSGDINGDNAGNSYHVVTGSGVDDSALLSGFTITLGKADSDQPQNGGGGILIVAGSPQFEQCRIVANQTAGASFGAPTGAGGGLYCDDGAPTFTDCVLNSNRTGDGSTSGNGGAAFITGASHVTMIGCTISGNSTGFGGHPAGGGKGGDGGAFYLQSVSTLTLIDCSVANNTAASGGSMNTAGGEGGGVYCSASAIICTHSQITGNRTSNVGQTAGARGGGIWCGNGSNLTLTGCVIANNLTGRGGSRTAASGFAGGDGGGVYMSGTAATIYDCEFNLNRTGSGGFGRPGGAGGGGGALACYSSSVELSDCTFDQNSTGAGGGTDRSGGTGGSGGAVLGRNNAVLSVAGCTFAANLTGSGAGGTLMGPGGDGGGGAGISAEIGATLAVKMSTFAENRTGVGGGGGFGGGSGGNGGAIRAASAGFCRVHNSRFIENATGDGATLQSGGAGGNGAGISCDGTVATIANCEFAGNATGNGGSSSGGAIPGGNGGAGGGVYAAGAALTVANCTLAQNSSGAGGAGTPAGTSDGGGIYSTAGTIRNSIVWENSPNQIGGVATATYCDVQGGFAGAGNIAADPSFADSAGGDFRLVPGSRCIDAGENGGVAADLLDLDEDGDLSERTPLALDGNVRYRDHGATPDTGAGTPPLVDMGAYEFDSGLPCPADLNQDALIDLTDLSILLAHFGVGADPEQGDLDGDDDIDIADLAALLSQFGAVCP